jgi:hypothetical protein
MARRRKGPARVPPATQQAPVKAPSPPEAEEQQEAYAPGPVETKVRADIDALVSGHPMGEALAEMAFALARTLDKGAGLAVAAVNRELRANLLELSRLGVDGDDDFDDQLSTPVRDEEEP